MTIRTALAIAGIAFVLVGCAGAQQKLDMISGVYTAANEPVPAEYVVPLANTFDILKAAATNYGRYCIDHRMEPSICSADIRRKVIASVRSGTGVRNQLKASVRNGEPVLSSVYNVMVSAVNGLKASPAATSKFGGATP